tara:strand:+ start:97 stop:231 length:135 start_codon:yes stop_codon:yes gene_type:complete
MILKDKICRKSSKTYSGKHTFLISMCDADGKAVCSFCQKHWDQL